MTSAPQSGPSTVGVAFCRTLVDEWVRAGVTDAVVSPGSRSTPLVVALAERLRVQVILDERSAAYTALGLALASGRPTVVACTSGTAATHFHGAVVEADQAGVPLVVCTADRPVGLRDVGAPQTTDQVHLYGRAPRWFADPGVPDRLTASTWRSLGARAICEATGPRPGPVHLNLAFAEPLLDPDPFPGPPGRADGGPWHRSPRPAAPVDPPADVRAMCDAAVRPLVVAGHGAPGSLDLDGVPVLNDHRGAPTGTVAHWDLLVREPGFAASHEPDLVVRAGLPPASKVLARWLAGLDAPQIVLAPAGRWVDPDRVATWVLASPTRLSLRAHHEWATSWHRAGSRAADAVDAVLGAHDEATEPGVARRVMATRREGSSLVVSSSMPVRDLEAFAAPRSGVRVLANRGVNGIDGVTSTAVGVALTGAPTTLLIGDLALLHDQGALTGLAERDLDLELIVVDNRGGGIFSFLPQAQTLDGADFERFFATPQHLDPTALFTAHGIAHDVVATASELDRALDDSADAGGVRAIVVSTDRVTNTGVHDELAGAVAVALGR